MRAIPIILIGASVVTVIILSWNWQRSHSSTSDTKPDQDVLAPTSSPVTPTPSANTAAAPAAQQQPATEPEQAPPVKSEPTTLPPAGPALELVTLDDGRILAGWFETTNDRIVVRAVSHGGAVMRIKDITLAISAEHIRSRQPYQNEFGDLSQTPAIPEPDPERAAMNAKARKDAEAKLAIKHAAAAEKLEKSRYAQRLDALSKRVQILDQAIDADERQERQLAAYILDLEGSRTRQRERLDSLDQQRRTLQERLRTARHHDPAQRPEQTTNSELPNTTTGQQIADLDRQISATQRTIDQHDLSLGTANTERRTVNDRVLTQRSARDVAQAELAKLNPSTPPATDTNNQPRP